MKKRKYYPEVLALAAALTVVSAGIGKTWSYFTTYTEAAGGYTIHLGDRTEINETFSGWTKHLTITSDEDSQPVYIRARAFCGSEYTVLYSGNGWSLGADGYYYYDSILYGGGSAETLDLKIEGIPQEPEALESFNVVVIYESTPVKYHEDGSPYSIQETDWDEILDAGRTEASGSEEDTFGNAGESSEAGDSASAGNSDSTGESGEAEDAAGSDDAAGTEGGAE